MRTLDDVTYELFGIDPEAFYATKFSDGDVTFIPTLIPPVDRRASGFSKFHLLIEHAQACPGHADKSFRVLDLGCGAGRFGAWLRHALPDCDLHGIDMSRACVDKAMQHHGYSTAVQASFLDAIPYPDDHFDFVFSMDVFGHIEFKHKDRVISEIRRVTKRGGTGLHGIEAGWVNYLHCDPSNPDDPIRQYVHIDGHIGVETVDDICARFAKQLSVRAAFPLLIYPILEVANLLTHHQWGPEFGADVAPLNTLTGRRLADAVLGEVNRRHLQALQEIFGPMITPKTLAKILPPGPLTDYIVRMTDWGGFAVIATAKAPIRRLGLLCARAWSLLLGATNGKSRTGSRGLFRWGRL